MPSPRRRRSMIIASVLLVVLAIQNGHADEKSRSSQRADQPAGNSVVRYAIDDFVAACVIRPEALIENANFWLLPIDSFTPAPLSLGRLEALDVEELAIFCGPASDRSAVNAERTDLEWAAAARFVHPIEVKPVLKKWRESLVPQVADFTDELVPFAIGDYECFQVPAGSFIPLTRSSHDLRFNDQNGLPLQKGIDIGDVYEYREYIEGATKASAIFTLDKLDQSDFVDGQLPLELRLRVFRIHRLDNEYSNEYNTAQLELRNPESGLRSEPIPFEAKSFVNQRFNVPRKFTAIDGDKKRQVDLLDDLVSNGRLEVILKGTEPDVYLGVGKYDLNVRTQRFEYAFVSGREMVVAQSAKTLEKMLRAAAAPGSLAQKLSQQAGNVVMTANVNNEARRRVLQGLVRTITESPDGQLWGDALDEMTASVNAKEPVVARLTATFVDGRSAAGAMRQLRQRIRSAKSRAHEGVEDSLNRVDSIASLVSMAFDFVPMGVPKGGSPSAAERASALLSIIDDSLNNIQIELRHNAVTVNFTQPESLTHLSETAQLALANIEEVYARDLFERERFDLGDEVYRRATSRLPHIPYLWFRRAHQLSYNMSPKFDGYQNRYVWVRRGIEALLDGAEQNPGSIDLTWMVARFIGRKIGSSDERAVYRELFSKDERLQRRIAESIDLEQTRSPDKKVDNWLVAKILFDRCIDRRYRDRSASTIPSGLFLSSPAATQARYARALDESGHWNDSLVAWKEAERLYMKFAEETSLTIDSEQIRLSDLESRRAQSGPDDPIVKRLQAARDAVRYDDWLAFCKFEQLEQVRSIRKLMYQAKQRARQPKPKEALNLYRQALQTLSQVQTQHPKQVSLFAGEFRDAETGYRKIAAELHEKEDPDLAPLLDLIKPTYPFSWTPLAIPVRNESKRQ